MAAKKVKVGSFEIAAGLTRRLIWHFQVEDRKALGIWHDGRVVDAADRPLRWLQDEARVRLWQSSRGRASLRAKSRP